MNRDPRVDPVPGDVLATQSFRIEVLAVEGGAVRSQITRLRAQDENGEEILALERWRFLRGGAQVIFRGPVEAP